MQAHRYFILVNDQQLDQVIGFDQATIVEFINEHIKQGQDNHLIFYRTVTWLEGDSDVVVKVDKEDILTSTSTQKVTGEHEIVKKIEEYKELLIGLQASMLQSEFWRDM